LLDLTSKGVEWFLHLFAALLQEVKIVLGAVDELARARAV